MKKLTPKAVDTIFVSVISTTLLLTGIVLAKDTKNKTDFEIPKIIDIETTEQETTRYVIPNYKFSFIQEHFENATTETVMEFETETSECETEEESPCNQFVELLARCIYAEAGNQDETGKRLVCDVILNRCDKFGMNIEEVIFQKNQFQVVSNGTIWKYTPTDDIYRIIYEEFETRYNNEVLYFRTNKYHSFGTPLFKHQDHYFSK